MNKKIFLPALLISVFVAYLCGFFLKDLSTKKVDIYRDKTEMINVIGLTVQDSLNELSKAGFNKVSLKGMDKDDISDRHWMVEKQSAIPGSWEDTDSEIVLTCARYYSVNLMISSDNNLLFDKYDIDVYIDNKYVGFVRNGGTRSETCYLKEGINEFIFINGDDSSVSSTFDINVSSACTINIKLSHGSSISVHDYSVEPL